MNVAILLTTTMQKNYYPSQLCVTWPLCFGSWARCLAEVEAKEWAALLSCPELATLPPSGLWEALDAGTEAGCNKLASRLILDRCLIFGDQMFAPTRMLLRIVVCFLYNYNRVMDGERLRRLPLSNYQLCTKRHKTMHNKYQTNTYKTTTLPGDNCWARLNASIVLHAQKFWFMW